MTENTDPIPFLLQVKRHGGSLVVSLNQAGVKEGMLFEGIVEVKDGRLSIYLSEASLDHEQNY